MKSSNKKINVSVICPYPIGLAPSQRFRIEMFIQNGNIKEFNFIVRPFLSKSAYSNLYLSGRTIYKSLQVLGAYIKRIFHLVECISSDFVLIHREASPLGPPVFEWILAKVLRKKIIFDFDDAIWLNNTTEVNKLTSIIKNPDKFKSICKYSYKISAGNAFLANEALKYNSNVELIPTIVDTENEHNPALYQKTDHKLTIGWTGSHSTLKYLSIIVPIISKLEKDFDFRFLIICDKKPQFMFDSMEYKVWNIKTEISDLMEIDIGIMPLEIDEWAKGKCGFKIIQYLSLGIPSIATDIPPNNLIIENEKSGFLVKTEEQWESQLRILLQESSLRKEFGENGMEHVQANFSKKAIEKKFISLFS